MADQKAENLLNLALDATAEELEKEVVGFYRDEVAADNPQAVDNVTAWFRSL